ncbi:MAG: rRNA adenine N-6-methyltransferase family protein [Sciscionella sp.]
MGTAAATPHSLAAHLDASGPVVAAITAVPREGFIPARMWVQDADDEPYTALDRDTEPDRWMRAVYSDRPIVTQWDDSATRWPDVGYRPSCSASAPSVVAGMLDALDLQRGHTVLEIGTGTGWNAALLAHVTGARVTSVEVDPALVAKARVRLTAIHSSDAVQVVHGDGAARLAELEPPYDRMIATAAVQLGRMPYPWVEQCRPGGVIVSPVRAELTSGPLVRLDVDEYGTATGRAVDLRVGFMELRAQRTPTASFAALRWDDPTADRRYTNVEPWSVLLPDAPRWAVAVAVPSCRYAVWKKTAQRPQGIGWLLDPVSGAWASVVPTDQRGRFAVRQTGPRRLWDEVETAYRWWQQHGKPPIEAWTWTVTRDRQRVELHC